jgi:hypothetical protein
MPNEIMPRWHPFNVGFALGAAIGVNCEEYAEMSELRHETIASGLVAQGYTEGEAKAIILFSLGEITLGQMISEFSEVPHEDVR